MQICSTQNPTTAEDRMCWDPNLTAIDRDLRAWKEFTKFIMLAKLFPVNILFVELATGGTCRQAPDVASDGDGKMQRHWRSRNVDVGARSNSVGGLEAGWGFLGQLCNFPFLKFAPDATDKAFAISMSCNCSWKWKHWMLQSSRQLFSPVQNCRTDLNGVDIQVSAVYSFGHTNSSWSPKQKAYKIHKLRNVD
jgi:hypothetical protein